MKAFWQRHFEHHGVFLAGSSTYEGLTAFEAKLECDLANLIERRASALVESPDDIVWLTGRCSSRCSPASRGPVPSG